MGRTTYAEISSWTQPSFGREAVCVIEESAETVIGPAWSSEPWGSSGFNLPEFRGGRLGAYRLIERVGRGRQADVWRAVRGESGVEEVALKVLPASARDPRRRAQLRHEADRGRRLVGASLLPTYEFGEVDGAVFMAMPLIVGCTLADILGQRRAFDEGRSCFGFHRMALADRSTYTDEVVSVLARVARAASRAHEGQVVHRDIKPGNILVRRDQADGVFLCDFGLARDLDVATAKQLRDGAGSPLYMAPERLLKRPADEVRGDVYALGVTLFEALTLSPPVVLPDDLPRALWVSFLASASPRLPSSVWPEIPEALETTIVRAMEHDPVRRHPTAAHFADDLENYLASHAPDRAHQLRKVHEMHPFQAPQCTLRGCPVLRTPLARPLPSWERARW